MKKRRIAKIKILVCKQCKDIAKHAQGQYVIKKIKMLAQKNINLIKYCRFCKTHTEFI